MLAFLSHNEMPASNISWVLLKEESAVIYGAIRSELYVAELIHSFYFLFTQYESNIHHSNDRIASAVTIQYRTISHGRQIEATHLKFHRAE